MKEVTAYQCDYCGKVLKLKSSAKRHERNCYKNIDSKSCYTCQFLSFEEITCGSWDEPAETFKSPVCKWKAPENEDYEYLGEIGWGNFKNNCPAHEPKEAGKK